MAATATEQVPATPDVGRQLDRVEQRLAEVLAELDAERAGRERLTELVHELTPIAAAVMGLASDTLADAEGRGWFTAVRHGAAVGGRLTAAFQRDWPQQPPSTLHLLRSLRDPRARLGLARVVSLLRALGADEPPSPDGNHRVKERF